MLKEAFMRNLESYIRDVPDFPKPGILFKDITTLLKDKEGFKAAIDALYEKVKDIQVDKVIGIESRGFIFAPLLAYRLGAGFVPVRKPGKLPAETVKISYDLEYGQDSLEIHKDALNRGDRVLIVDDLVATGGTAEAVCKMVEQLGGTVAAVEFLVELNFLKGRDRFSSYPFFSLLRY